MKRSSVTKRLGHPVTQPVMRWDPRPVDGSTQAIGGFAGAESGPRAARTSQVLTDTDRFRGGLLDVGLERLGQPQRDPGGGVAVVGVVALRILRLGRRATWTRTSSPSRVTPTDGEPGIVGVEQRSGDLVGGGGDGAEEGQPHGRIGRRGRGRARSAGCVSSPRAAAARSWSWTCRTYSRSCMTSL